VRKLLPSWSYEQVAHIVMITTYSLYVLQWRLCQMNLIVCWVYVTRFGKTSHKAAPMILRKYCLKALLGRGFNVSVN
jgi:hypothetical protein